MLLALLVAASLVVMATPALAIPTNCTSGIRRVMLGQFPAYYAYGVCYGGSGYYRVGFGCPYPGGSEWVWGPTKRVGQGESRAACPHHAKPTVTVVQTWS
jgi:hypothetical protein